VLHEHRCPWTTCISGFPCGSTSPISTARARPRSSEHRSALHQRGRQRADLLSARLSLFWRTERRTGVTAVEDRRQLGGTGWLVSDVTERHSRSEKNEEDYEQASDFHLLSPCRKWRLRVDCTTLSGIAGCSCSSCRDYRKRNWENQPVEI